MPEHAILDRIRSVPMPDSYRSYYAGLSTNTHKMFEAAAEAKSTLLDSSGMIEPKIAYDLADRVAKMHDIDIAEQLRDLLKDNGKELSALLISKEIALGKHLPQDAALEERLDLAVRVGLAVVTEGVTIAPLQGISEVKIKKNRDGTEYLSVSIAGPMRAAGGTESAVTMLIADHVRRATGLSEYAANSFDDETGRFVEELRIYEREAGNFQYRVLDEDIITVVSHLPVELDGVDTDPFEVVNHKNMARIKTDRVRGGALRVLNDGLIGRAKKLLKRIELYQLSGWGWLGDLKGAVQTGDKQEDAAAKRMREVITGRSVLSMPNRLGGFRLRYGRACNTGFASVGFHPVIAEILDHTIAVGTQVKIDMPGKGATVAFVDSIDAPTVRLAGGDLVKIRDVQHGVSLKPRIEKILHLGDILVSFGDFLENNTRLVPTGYVEEYWAEDLAARLSEGRDGDGQYGRFLDEEPSLEEAVEISRRLRVPLHPKYLYYWDKIGAGDLEALLAGRVERDLRRITYPAAAKRTLETLGVPHRARPEGLILEGAEYGVLYNLLFMNPLAVDGALPAAENISRASGIEIRAKFSTSIGVRIGRPEKAAPRHMKPPIHALFPVGDRGGATRDLIKASHQPSFYTNVSDRACGGCGAPSIGIRCQRCGSKTEVSYTCPSCREVMSSGRCERCKRKTLAYSYHQFPLKEKLMEAQEKIGCRAREPLKGVRELISQERIAEPIEKGLLRQHHGLSVFKDGTVRYDATNSPLTHFQPRWIGTPVPRLRELGYTHDADGAPLEDAGQTVELLMQDVVVPRECGRHLADVCRYIDSELVKFYGKDPVYGAEGADDLIGHLIIGLAPHTSVGIVGRIIGFAETNVCFGTPNWHSAKRRDADGDADSLMLLMDGLLNFSRQFLSDKIGGLMDAPLLIQPLVLPHESQPQAHNLEVVRSLPRQFFEDTLRREKAPLVRSVEVIKSRLGTAGQFSGYHFTHRTSGLTTSKPRSAYSTLGSMLDKLDMQIKNADLIEAVDTTEIVSNVITTHLVPDIIGNLRSYARQSFRCAMCGRSYRRVPLTRVCSCDNKLIQTITRSSVEKYLKLAKRLIQKYDVGEYQSGRIRVLADEIDLVFGKSGGDQSLLTDYS